MLYLGDKKKQAKSKYESVLKKRMVLLGRGHPSTIMVKLSIAIILFHFQDFKKAFMLLNECDKDIEESHYKYYDQLTFYLNFCSLLQKSQKYIQAQELYEELFRQFKEFEIDSHNLYIQLKISYANCLDKLKKHEMSLKVKLELEPIINEK